MTKIKLSGMLPKLAIDLTTAFYLSIAVAIIALTVIGSMGTAGIPCVLGTPLIVWFVSDLFTAAIFKAPLGSFVLYSSIAGLLTLGNWVYDKLSINLNKTVKADEPMQTRIIEDKTLEDSKGISLNEENIALTNQNNIMYPPLFAESKNEASNKQPLNKEPIRPITMGVRVTF